MAVAACAAPALAEDFVGNVELKGNISDIKHNSAKFNEYRDLSSGASGSFLMDYANDKGGYFFFTGENFGYNADRSEMRRDQGFFLKAGRQEEFKVSLFYNEIPHNLTYGALSLYEGIGSSNLKSLAASNAANTVGMPYYTKSFDYVIDRTNYGAEVDLSFKTPFFFTARYDRTLTKGLLPVGTYLSQEKELPAPIDFATDNIFMNTGYRSNNLIVALDGSISQFSNANQMFTTTYAGTAHNFYLPPNNSSYKVGGNVMYRLPFWNTTFLARGSYSMNESSVNLRNGEAITENNNGQFNGKIAYKTASVAITTSPIKVLDAKVYVNILDKKNNSPSYFVYGNAAAPATSTTEKFDYNKLNGGLDLGIKLPAKTKLSAGYEYLRINRTMMVNNYGTALYTVRADAPQTSDHIFYAQVKNNLFEMLTGKLRYQYLSRTSQFNGGIFNTDSSAGFLKQWWRPMDTADKNQHAIKAGLDFEPMDNLSFSAEYAYKMNDYNKSVLGMQNDSRHEVYVDASYSIANVKLNPYAEFEFTNNESKHRRYTNQGNASPFGPDVANTAYNWNSKRKDISYAFGLNGDVDVIKDKLTVSGNYRYDKAAGREEFSVNAGAITSPPLLVDNTAVDNYTKQTLGMKMKYNLTKSLNFGLGYTYETLTFNDDHYTDYSYMFSKTAGVMMTGAYNNPNYDAHVGYLTVGYKF